MNTEFNIPKTWKVVTFEDVSEGKNAIVDGPFGSNLKTSDYIEDKVNGVPVLTTKNLEGDYSDDKVRFISKDKFETLKRSQVNPGDILVAKIGSIGKTGIYPKNARTAIIPANLLKFTVSKNVNFNYVFYYLNSRGLQNRIKKIATATAQPAFNVTKFRKLRIPLPPLPEQQAIVSKIEELLSDLENGKQQLQTAQQQLKVYRQSLLKWAFEGKLTEEWRKKQRKLLTSKEFVSEIIKTREIDYSIKLDKWKKSKVNSINEKIVKPQKPSNLDPKNNLFEGLIEKKNIPFEWEIVPLVFVSDNQPNSIVDGPFGSSINVNEDYIDKGVPVIRMVNIRPFKFVQDQMKFIKESKFQSLRRHNILPEDILIAKVGATIGDCCIYPINQPEAMLSTTGSCRIRVDRNVINIKYLEYNISFHRNTLKDIASQTAQPFLNMKVIKSFPIVLPTIQEQQLIVSELESKLTVCDKIEETISQSLQQAETLRQSILKKAFEGKLVTQNPNDEPAPKLLERIKAESPKNEVEKKKSRRDVIIIGGGEE